MHRRAMPRKQGVLWQGKAAPVRDLLKGAAPTPMQLSSAFGYFMANAPGPKRKLESEQPAGEPKRLQKKRKQEDSLEDAGSREFPYDDDTNPEDFLKAIFAKRGYARVVKKAEDTVYSQKPSERQLQSYSTKLLSAIRSGDIEKLKKLKEDGVDFNACNQFGESIVHMTARRGNVKLLRYLLDNGASLCLSDDFGRTPLHDAFWTHEVKTELVETMLDKDLTLLRVADSRGCTPLQYTRRQDWGKWCRFFDAKKEIYWRQLGGHDAIREPEEADFFQPVAPYTLDTKPQVPPGADVDADASANADADADADAAAAAAEAPAAATPLDAATESDAKAAAGTAKDEVESDDGPQTSGDSSAESESDDASETPSTGPQLGMARTVAPRAAAPVSHTKVQGKVFFRTGYRPKPVTLDPKYQSKRRTGAVVGRVAKAGPVRRATPQQRDRLDQILSSVLGAVAEVKKQQMA